MLDWKVREDEPPPKKPLSDEGSDAPKQRKETTSRRLWWYAIVVVLVMVAGAGGWVVWNRVQKGDEAMRRDLLAFVRREEQARRLGQQENAADFLAESGIPSDFAEAYTALFEAPVVPVGVEVTVDEFEVVGDTANVLVGVGAQRQRRTYRLTEVGWRRVPLEPEAGAEIRLVDAERGVTIIARESDEAFAQQFYDDIPSLMELFSAWGGSFDNRIGVTLRIIPAELQGIIPVGTVTDTALTINSPQVVELPHHWTLSGEVAVRYEIANLLLTPARPSRPDIFATPQHPRLWDAARTVMALRWAMPPQEYEDVVAGWRSTAFADGWQHPFDSFYTFGTRLDPFAPLERQAEMLLVADTLYAEKGLDGMVALFNATPDAASWDEAFRAVTGETTAELEAQARGDEIVLPSVPLPLTGHLPPDLPMPITMRGVPFIVDGLAEPIVLEDLMQATIDIEMGDGSHTTLPGTCATIFPSMTLEGDWLEEGLRVRATTLTVTNFAPALFQGIPAPPDAIAYVTIDNPLPAEQAQGRQLAALMVDGSTVPLLTWSLSTLYIAPPSATTMLGNDAIFFQAASRDGACPVTWIARYRPDTGLDGVWLVSLELGARFPQPLWDSTTNRGMMALPSSDGLSTAYWWLNPGDNTLLAEPDGTVSYGDVLLLRPGHDEVVIPVDIGNNTLMVRRIDVNTGAVAKEYFAMLIGTRLSTAYDSTGRYLFAAPTIRDSVNPGVDHSRGSVYDEDSGEESLLWPATMGVIYNVFPDATEAVWYATTFSPESRRAFYLLGDASLQPLFVSNRNRLATQLIACQSGGAAYVTGAARMDRPGVADSPYTLTRVDATGQPRFSDILLPDGYTLMMCP